jgi:hypothetical protein
MGLITMATETVVGDEYEHDSDENRSSSDTSRRASSRDQSTTGIDRPPGPGDDSGQLDTIFSTLKNQRRRYVLHYLDVTDGPVALGDLAEQIAAWENDKEPRLITSSERKRVYVGLYQCHLPKLDDSGAVSYNKPRGIVERGELFDAYRAYLPSCHRTRESTSYRLVQRIVCRIASIVSR